MVLFVIKKRQDKFDPYRGKHTGLYNSVSFVRDMLQENKINAEIEEVQDGNDINRVIVKHKIPKYLILEALWATPEKVAELQKMYPNINFLIHLHSDVPFIATEGISMSWVQELIKIPNVKIIANSPRIFRELNFINKVYKDKIIELLNFYPQSNIKKDIDKTKDNIDISCFGATRPLKNNLMQAICAIEFCERKNKKVNFHININHLEQTGDNIVKNIIHLFGSEQIYNRGHRLVIHKWLEHDAFIEVCSKIDIAMQVSYNETFNIVSCDHLSQGVPVVGMKKELPWSCDAFNVSHNDSNQIIKKLNLAYTFPRLHTFINRIMLKKYTNKSRKQWLSFLKDEINA